MSSVPASLKDTKQASSGALPRNRYVAYACITVGGCAADLLTKHLVFQWRGFPPNSSAWWLWENHIGVETSLNPGALFGLGAGHSTLFAGLSIGAALGIFCWLFVMGAARDWFLALTLSVVTGGILGNLFDRCGLYRHPDGTWHNEVRDWILFRYPPYTWPNFNLADSLLVCGAAALVWHAFFVRDEQ